MRDNLPTMLRAAAKEWREENKTVATGATRYDFALEEAAEAIEELSKLVDESIPKDDAEIIIAEVAKPRWIPVTERLPKKELGIYWICTDSGYQCECRWTNNMYGLGESDNWGWHIMDKPQYQKVIAWRELLEPYEPPKENNDGN